MLGPGSMLGHHDGFVDRWAEAARRRARLQFGAIVVVLSASAAALAVLASDARPIVVDRAVSVPKPKDHSPTVRVELATTPARSDPAPPPVVSAPPPSTATVRRRSILAPSGSASRPLASRTPDPPRRGVPPKENPPADPVALGRELFARRWKPNDPRSHGGDGLGPVYNADSCLACHFQGGPGGAGPVEFNVAIIEKPPTSVGMGCRVIPRVPLSFDGRTILRPVNGPTEWSSVLPGLAKSTSLVVHHFGVAPGYAALRATVLKLAHDPAWTRTPGFGGLSSSRLAQRNTPPLFGAGLIDAIPDRVLLEEEARHRAGAGPTGKVHRLKDGRIGRFGWKAQTASLSDFVQLACANELGLEVPSQHQSEPAIGPVVAPSGLDLDARDCEALAAYIRQLPAPSLQHPGGSCSADDIEAGRWAFKTIGCAGCHTPSLGAVEGIYSDLLMHDLGPAVASFGNYYGIEPAGSLADPSAPGPSEWRTPPLWGLAASGPYLHDGRAQTIEEAIAAHGAQADKATRNFFLQSSERRGQLLAFLNALAPPPNPLASPDVDRPNPFDPSIARWQAELEAFSRETRKDAEEAPYYGVKSKLDAAKNLEKMGKTKGALEFYRRVVEDFPASEEAHEARRRIAQIGRE